MHRWNILIFKSKKILVTHTMLRVNWSKTMLKPKLDGRDPRPSSVARSNVFCTHGFKSFATAAIFTMVNRICGLTADVLWDLRRPEWGRRDVGLHTELWDYNTAVLFVLLYETETWPLSKSRLPRHRLRIPRPEDNQVSVCGVGGHWLDLASNEETRRRTGQNPPCHRSAPCSLTRSCPATNMMTTSPNSYIRHL